MFHLDSATFEVDNQLFRESPDFSGGNNEPGITWFRILHEIELDVSADYNTVAVNPIMYFDPLDKTVSSIIPLPAEVNSTEPEFIILKPTPAR